MARIRRKIKQTRGWTEHHRCQLMTGHSWSFLGGFGADSYNSTFDLASALECWAELGDEIIREHIAIDPLEMVPGPTGEMRVRDHDLRTWGDQRLGPGSRPWMWWRVDSPERRQVVSGIHPFDDPAWNAHADEWHADNKHDGPNGVRRLWFGVPGSMIIKDQNLDFESQADFIGRLGLWIGDEESRCCALWDKIESADFYRKLCNG